MNAKSWFAIGCAVVLIVAAFFLFNSNIFAASNSNSTAPEEFVQISAIVLFGLGLTVILFAILAIVFSFLELTDSKMALGLPDGSIRALLAFSLVLIFVCIATYLYNRVDKDTCQSCSKTLPLVTDSQVSDLKTNFVVVAEPALDKDGNARYEQIQGPDGKPKDDLKHPLSKVTYYPKPNPNAADFAKQIFTTLATIFVSVVSFYFGSSVTTSAVKAAQGPGSDKLQTALTTALADSHNAQVTRDQAKAKLDKADAESKDDPDNPTKKDARQNAQNEFNKADSDLLAKQKMVQDAQKAVNDARSGSNA